MLVLFFVRKLEFIYYKERIDLNINPNKKQNPYKTMTYEIQAN